MPFGRQRDRVTRLNGSNDGLLHIQSLNLCHQLKNKLRDVNCLKGDGPVFRFEHMFI